MQGLVKYKLVLKIDLFKDNQKVDLFLADGLKIDLFLTIFPI